MKKIANYVLIGIACSFLLGVVISAVLLGFPEYLNTGELSSFFDPAFLLDPGTYLYGVLVFVLLVLLYFIFNVDSTKRSGKMLNSKINVVKSGLENAAFMTDKERDFNFQAVKYNKLNEEKKDGIPVRAIYSAKKKDVDINLASPMHGLIIGSTGSGKTTTFINPMIQILASSAAGSSMICTDPKGELFQLHSKFLQSRGYRVMVLDLRDPYSSFRWNPLGDLYDRYQLYLNTGNEIYRRTDSAEDSGLELLGEISQYGKEWYEYEGKAYYDKRHLLGVVKVARQKIYDEVYEDLNDLTGVLCPIESQDDPVWEKGARSIIMATCLAMLEDSENPELEMTREKFCFYNINKAISNSENEFAVLKHYFEGRSQLSKAVGLSRQVLSAADTTLSSYMSIAFDKMSMFNDEGLCALTSETDIQPEKIAMEPTALFLKIPDEKDTRHALAAVFVLSIYKALIKVASSREDLSLPRNVYYILDEFGNMPKIDKFDKMITVGRSRKIWFNLVVQSYAQLNNVYGDKVADIIKSNCGMKMFIGSNDIGTCEEFSKLCGNLTVSTGSVSSGTQSKSGDINYSQQIQQRPLIYPSELQKLNNKTDSGNAIIVTFGNSPLKTKFTPSYKCSLYQFGIMDLSELAEHPFFGDEVFYNLDDRNYLILEAGPEPENNSVTSGEESVQPEEEVM